MKNKVCIRESKFHINRGSKTVVCVLDVNLQLQSHPAWDVIFRDYWKHLPFIKNYGDFKVRGIARCSDDDIFDEDKGRKIAESRAKARAYDIACKVYLAISNSLDKYGKEIENTLGACVMAKEVEEAHIEELIN